MIFLVFFNKKSYIVIMKNSRKIALFLVLFVGFTAYSYGESFYSMAFGFNRSFEQYPSENYGRDLDGSYFDVMLHYYPEEFPLGWFLKTSFGSYQNGIEWMDDKLQPLSAYSISDIRISAGPSMKLQLGQRIHFPLSMGLVFSNYWEESDYGNYFDGYYSNFYRALNIGLSGDVAIVINPFRRFTIINGLNLSWDFLHWERGYVQGNLRNINNGRFNLVNYHAFKMTFFMGIGLRFNDIAREES